MKKKKLWLGILSIIGILSITIGLSVAFFNYTRTGDNNTLSVGRISFNSTQTNIELENVFPTLSTNLNSSNSDTATITITGDTTYSEGIEYKVTIETVNNTINGKELPISLNVTASNLGTEDSNYYTDRKNKTKIYMLNSEGEANNGKYIAVGYIPSGVQGVNGSIDITAFIDTNKIVISDTYDGTESNLMGTTNDFVAGRTVFTTSEWNSFNSSNPLSFKVRVEANEGIWVNNYEIYGSDTITMKNDSSTTSHYDLLQYVYDPTSPTGLSLGNDVATWEVVPQTNDITVNNGVVTINSTNTLDNFTLKSIINGTIVQKNINVILDNIPTDLLHTVTMYSGERVNHLNGTIESVTTSMRSDYIECDNTKTLFFDYINYYYSAYVYPYMAFYDENYEYISGIKIQNLTNNLPVYKLYNYLIQGYAIDIPNNAKYMRINTSATTYNAYANNYYYVDNDAIELVPLTLNNYSSVSTLNGLNIVNFGDSIFGRYDDGKDISSYMETFYGSTNYNVGFGSTRMGATGSDFGFFSLYNLVDAVYSNDYTNQDAHNNLQSYYSAHLATLKGIDFSTIDYVTIGYGRNDFVYSSPIENNDLLDINTYKGAARYSINRLKQINPNLKIVLITPIYYFDSDYIDASNNETVVGFISEYGAALKELAIEYDNVYVYDAFNDLQINASNKYLYFTNRDRVHPIDNGIKLYAYKLGMFIESIESE